jgi:hypothetical protein
MSKVRVAAAVAYVALWVVVLLFAEVDSDAVAVPLWLAPSIAVGFVVGRWWAPALCLVFLVAELQPCDPAVNECDVSVLGLFLLFGPLTALLIAGGVLARKGLDRRRR